MAATKPQWLCITPDAAGVRSKRVEVRPQHLEAIKPKVESGLVTLGGATLEGHAKEGEAPSFTGSVMIVEADTEKEVKDFIEKDIYYTSGVWDPKKIQIIPFKAAVWKGR